MPQAAQRNLRDTIVRLLGSIGSHKEVNEYLGRFSKPGTGRFAVVKVGGAVLRDDLDALASALAFLDRVGLCPVVVHGAGPQLDEALSAAGVETPKIDGLRVTSPEALRIVRRVMQETNLRLVDALEAHGARARPVTSGVFRARVLDAERFGLVGEVESVELESLRTCIRSGHLPILTCLGETEGGQILNINADMAARELSRAVKPFKVVFLTGVGGLLDGEGELIPSVNLAEEYDALMAEPWIHSGMRVKLQQIKELLDVLPRSSSVSITDPDHLAKELFTHSGAGTLVRRGERVLRFDGREGVDEVRLRALVESAFGGSLDPHWFDERVFHRIYVTEEYRATAVVTLEAGEPYLDKFGTAADAQGEGIGRSVWWRLTRENPRLFWRSRVTNPLNAWYFREAEGTARAGEWIVFWRGFGDDFAGIERCVRHIRAVPATVRRDSLISKAAP